MNGIFLEKIPSLPNITVNACMAWANLRRGFFKRFCIISNNKMFLKNNLFKIYFSNEFFIKKIKKWFTRFQIRKETYANEIHFLIREKWNQKMEFFWTSLSIARAFWSRVQNSKSVKKKLKIKGLNIVL